MSKESKHSLGEPIDPRHRTDVLPFYSYAQREEKLQRAVDYYTFPSVANICIQGLTPDQLLEGFQKAVGSEKSGLLKIKRRTDCYGAIKLADCVRSSVCSFEEFFGRTKAQQLAVGALFEGVEEGLGIRVIGKGPTDNHTVVLTSPWTISSQKYLGGSETATINTRMEYQRALLTLRQQRLRQSAEMKSEPANRQQLRTLPEPQRYVLARALTEELQRNAVNCLAMLSAPFALFWAWERLFVNRTLDSCVPMFLSVQTLGINEEHNWKVLLPSFEEHNWKVLLPSKIVEYGYWQYAGQQLTQKQLDSTYRFSLQSHLEEAQARQSELESKLTHQDEAVDTRILHDLRGRGVDALLLDALDGEIYEETEPFSITNDEPSPEQEKLEEEKTRAARQIDLSKVVEYFEALGRNDDFNEVFTTRTVASNKPNVQRSPSWWIGTNIRPLITALWELWELRGHEIDQNHYQGTTVNEFCTYINEQARARTTNRTTTRAGLTRLLSTRKKSSTAIEVGELTIKPTEKYSNQIYIERFGVKFYAGTVAELLDDKKTKPTKQRRQQQADAYPRYVCEEYALTEILQALPSKEQLSRKIETATNRDEREEAKKPYTNREHIEKVLGRVRSIIARIERPKYADDEKDVDLEPLEVQAALEESVSSTPAETETGIEGVIQEVQVQSVEKLTDSPARALTLTGSPNVILTETSQAGFSEEELEKRLNRIIDKELRKEAGLNKKQINATDEEDYVESVATPKKKAGKKKLSPDPVMTTEK